MRIAANAVIAFTISLTLSACAAPQGRQGQRLAFESNNPTALITLDIAMNREAQEKGAYVALRDQAAERAVTFSPRPVNARPWLRDQDAPTMAISWQPHRVILSCDGKTGVTTGAIRWGETDGYYTTVWQYFAPENRPNEGEWRWVLSHGDGLESPRATPEFLQTESASCEGSPGVRLAAPPTGARLEQVQSADQSLSWSWLYRPDGSRTISVNIWDGTKLETVLKDDVAAPAVSVTPVNNSASK